MASSFLNFAVLFRLSHVEFSSAKQQRMARWPHWCSISEERQYWESWNRNTFLCLKMLELFLRTTLLLFYMESCHTYKLFYSFLFFICIHSLPLFLFLVKTWRDTSTCRHPPVAPSAAQLPDLSFLRHLVILLGAKRPEWLAPPRLSGIHWFFFVVNVLNFNTKDWNILKCNYFFNTWEDVEISVFIYKPIKSAW